MSRGKAESTAKTWFNAPLGWCLDGNCDKCPGTVSNITCTHNCHTKVTK